MKKYLSTLLAVCLIKFTADGGAAAYIHSPVCLYDVGDLDFSFTSLDDVEIIE